MKSNKYGFTLAELLIVVAIIAVLVAIAIPVFFTELERSKDAADLANVRSAYAEASADLLVTSPGEDGSTVATSSILVKSSGGPHTYAGWSDGSYTIAGVTISAPSSESGQYLQLTMDSEGVVTASWVDPS